MHKYIYVALLALIGFPLATYAAYNDVGLTTDAIFTVGSYNLLVTGSAGEMESIVASPTDLTFTMPTNSSLTVSSNDRILMTIGGIDSSYYTTSCSAASNTVTINSIPVGDTKTVVITPLSTKCDSGVSAVVSSSGSGGSSISSIQNINNPTPTPPVTLNTSQSTFSVDLARGVTGDDVTRLQQLLASDKSIYPEGSVTGYFGPATERAVKRFQTKYGISAIGKVGPLTRVKLASVFSKVAAPATTPVTAVVKQAPVVSGSAVFSANIRKGSSNEDVKRLQQLLNKDSDTRISSSGPGSPGNETTSYGSLTEKAVQNFQIKYKIAAPGDAGFGSVGPMTRAMLQEIFGK